ncbi:FAD-dependent oxidoreductase, partial [Thermodesulfobacteriota bacterium]
FRNELDKVAGFHVGPIASAHPDVFWVNNFIKGLNPLKVEDLTWVEVNVRNIMLPVHEYLKKKIPGFKDSFIYDSASQIGTRGSRRLIGEYVLTREDAKARKNFKDTVAVFPKGVPLTFTPEEMPENVGLPYRSLLPINIDNLLVAGRCFSSDPGANTMFNVIPHCIAMGQAAGTAAAIAVKNSVNPKKIEYSTLHKTLSAQGVTLPALT